MSAEQLLDTIFNPQEAKTWRGVIKIFTQKDYWEKILSYVDGKTEEIPKEIIEDAMKILEYAMPTPLGSRFIPPAGAGDIIAKYMVENFNISLDALYNWGEKVKEDIAKGKTILILPQRIFEERGEFLTLITATTIYLYREAISFFQAFMPHYYKILQEASRNEDFRSVLSKFGLVSINPNTGAVTVDLDKFLSLLTDTEFLSEAFDYLETLLPIELIIGKQSAIAHAISSSVANLLLLSHVTAVYLNKGNEFDSLLDDTQDKLQKIEQKLQEKEPNFPAIKKDFISLMEEMDDFVGEYIATPLAIGKILAIAEQLNIYPDLAVEFLLIAHRGEKAQDSQLWHWLIRTQEMSLSIAQNASPIVRQPIYWFLLSLIRLATIRENWVKVLSNLSQ